MIVNYVLTVFNKVEEHLLLHFVCFLTYLSIYDEINCKISSYGCSNNLNAVFRLESIHNLCEAHDLYVLFIYTLVKFHI